MAKAPLLGRPATRRRLRAALRRLPVADREAHVAALGMLLHLVEHLPEHREPVAYVAGVRAFKVPALRWAAAQLARGWIKCTAADCASPDHVTLVDRPVEVEGTR